MGFSDAGCYGGEICTPNLDSLAAGRGCGFTQAYSTGRCWPSRGCLMSEALRPAHSVAIRRRVSVGAARASVPRGPCFSPERLAPLGYHSYHSGKWHIDGTPKAGGFERSWGAQKAGCDWDRFFSTGDLGRRRCEGAGGRGRTRATTPPPPFADHAIECLKLHRQHHGDAPFFQYVAFYSPHFPLHALKGRYCRLQGPL